MTRYAAPWDTRHVSKWPEHVSSVSSDDDNADPTPCPRCHEPPLTSQDAPALSDQSDITRCSSSQWSVWLHKMLQLSIRDQARTSCGVSEAGEAISQSYQSLNQLMRATPGRGRVRGHRTNCDIACGLHLNQVWEINHMSSFRTMVLFIINPINTVLGTPPSVRAGVREWTCVVWVEDKWFIDTKIGLKKYFCICD